MTYEWMIFESVSSYLTWKGRIYRCCGQKWIKIWTWKKLFWVLDCSIFLSLPFFFLILFFDIKEIRWLVNANVQFIAWNPFHLQYKDREDAPMARVKIYNLNKFLSLSLSLSSNFKETLNSCPGNFTRQFQKRNDYNVPIFFFFLRSQNTHSFISP